MRATKTPKTFRLFVPFALAFFFALATQAPADIPARIGGGNFPIRGDQGRFETLRHLGAGMCRIPISPGDYWDGEGRRATPERMDQGVLMAWRHGVRPMVLFEYYTRWHGELGDTAQWKAIGQAFAERFHPGSPWLAEQGVDDPEWGIVFYSAINEPMWRDNNPEPIPVEAYVRAMEGLADGVHAVDRALKVSPGGFQEVPLFQKRNPYFEALAPLYNQGKLHAIDIHRYWDVEYVPMERGRQFSLQTQFDDVRAHAGITADVRFYTTEMNFKKRLVSEDEAAQGFLTALWDALTVVNAEGQPVTEFVMPWNIFHLESRDEHYGLSQQADPWTPNARGRVLEMVCRLTAGAEMTSVDPRGTGVTVLEGVGRKVWVWQNRPGWSSLHGGALTVRDIPSGATEIAIYGWKGLERTAPTEGRAEMEIADLEAGQTWMLVARVGEEEEE